MESRSILEVCEYVRCSLAEHAWLVIAGALLALLAERVLPWVWRVLHAEAIFVSRDPELPEWVLPDVFSARAWPPPGTGSRRDAQRQRGEQPQPRGNARVRPAGPAGGEGHGS